MHIPRIWTKSSTQERTHGGQTVDLTVWGWGDDENTARQNAAQRLSRLADRIRRGDPFPDKYTYGDRPLREEILDTIRNPASSEPIAIITRNSYGSQILNAANLLFLDIDIQPGGMFKRLFGRSSPETAALDKLRSTLQQHAAATFRIYKTAAGLRAMAIDRAFDPKSDEAQRLMKATDTDPAFAKLCQVQSSFRARLTPKPWRCKCSVPPGPYPRETADSQQDFAGWLADYETASSRHATCRYLETIGNASPSAEMKQLVDLHDKATRSGESLPLA